MSHVDPTWILLPYGNGYCWGVEAHPKNHLHVELHGGFASRTEAVICKQTLSRDFDDYELIEVVKIETPAA